IEVDEMHRAALAARTARRFAVNLGHHPFEVTALGQIVGVGTMTGEHVVPLFERAAGAGGRCLLADAQMHGAAHLLFGIVRGDALFYGADARHLAVEPEPEFAAERRRCDVFDEGLMHTNGYPTAGFSAYALTSAMK